MILPVFYHAKCVAQVIIVETMYCAEFSYSVITEGVAITAAQSCDYVRVVEESGIKRQANETSCDDKYTFIGKTHLKLFI